MELETPLIVRPQDLGASDHLHAVLRPAEHARPGLPEGILVHDDLAKIADDVIGALPHSDAAHDGAFDAVGQFAMDVPGQRQVVLREEIEGVGIDDLKNFGRQFVDAARREIGIERLRGVSQFANPSGNAVQECFLRAPAEGQCLSALEAFHRLDNSV